MKKTEEFKPIINFLSSTIVIIVLVVTFWAFWMEFYSDNIWVPFYRKGNWLLVALYTILLFFFVNTYGGFKVGYLKKGEVIFSQNLSIFCLNVITYIQICLLDHHFINAIPIAILMVVQCTCVILWANIFDFIYSKLFPPRKMILVYGERPAFGLKEKINARDDKYDICETVNIRDGLDIVYNKIREFEAVIIGDIPSQVRNQIMKYCFENSIRTYMLPKISDIILRGSNDIHLFDSPLLLARNTGLTFEQKALKRLIDIMVSIIMLVLTSPLMLIVAISIKLYDGGNVLYKQTRLTIDERKFEIYKFRSMIMNAEKDGIARLSMEGDSRITPIGKIIRATRLDELPQLFNILRGDMSLVGPRPERPQIAEEYRESMPEFDCRLKVKAGLTGYAQIYGKYNTTPYDKLKLDLMYIQNYSFRLDLRLILMTLKVVFMKESTEGIAEGQTTATVDPGMYHDE